MCLVDTQHNNSKVFLRLPNYIAVSLTRVPAPPALQHPVCGIRRVVLAMPQHSTNCVPHKSIPNQACDVGLRHLRPYEHHERRRSHQMSAGRMDQARLLPAELFLLSLWVCYSSREGPCRTHVRSHCNVVRTFCV